MYQKAWNYAYGKKSLTFLTLPCSPPAEVGQSPLRLAIHPERMRFETRIAFPHFGILRNQDFNLTRFIILVHLPDRFSSHSRHTQCV